MNDVAEWLASLDLAQYSDTFLQNDVNAGILPLLTADDLKDIGVSSVGHRRKLLEAILALSGEKPGDVTEPTLLESPSPKPLVDAEHRQIAIIFCDLVGSTALSQSLDAEELRDTMRAYQDAVTGAIARYEGHIAKYMGDGVLAYFGWPIAYEDQADRAVRAGLDAVLAVSQLTLNNGQKLSARVGIATGQVVVGDLIGETGHDSAAVTGETPNLAARLQGVAEEHQVVIDANTRRLIGTAFKLKDIGKHDLKGFSELVSVTRVVGEDSVESRFDVTRASTLAPMVGREHELGLLLERWDLAKGGEGQIVELSGEAGIGKSRITRALFESIDAKSRFLLRYQCSPHHTNSAYYPIIQQLERAAKFTSSDEVETRLDKMESLLRLSAQDLKVTAPLFASLLSLSGEKRYGQLELTPEQLREKISDALMDQVLGLARNRPILFVVEDAHWIDPTTLAFLEQLASSIDDIPILVLITYREGKSQPMVSASQLTSITLNRLSRAQGRNIIAETGGKTIPPDVVDQIIARSDGVPLYIEELTRAVAETGREARKVDIPDTLQASLTARLDRLGDVREILQIGAIVGRDFGQDLLSALVDWPEEKLERSLERMVDSELVFRHGRPPDVTYTFKHALVQDAAYQSLLKQTRQKLHLKVAELLESQFIEIAHNQPELLGRHYTEAGLSERSIKYWFKAGQKAIKHSANIEAIAHLTRGRMILAEQSENMDLNKQDLDFCLALGPALMSIKGLASPEAEQVYIRARRLCEHSNDSALSFQATWGLWLVYQQRGQIDLAQSVSDEVLSLAEQQRKNVDHNLQAHHAAWTTQLFVGKISESLAHTLQGDALYDIERHKNHAFTYGGHDPGVCAKTTASEALCLLGHVDQAVQNAEQGVSLAKQLSHPFSLAMAQYFVAQVYQYRQEAKFVRSFAQETISLCDSHGFESFKAQATVLMGWATAVEGESEIGIQQIRDGLVAWQSTGTGMRRPYFLALLADALLRDNQITAALKTVEEAEALIEQSSETRWLAETIRLKGVLMDRTGAEVKNIERTYQYAMEIASGQDALWLQIRVAISLGRYWNNNGKESEAYNLLNPLYVWFTEGFETPDLKDAKLLLDAMSAVSTG